MNNEENKMLSVQITNDLDQKITQKATELGLTKSSYVRMQLKQEVTE